MADDVLNGNATSDQGRAEISPSSAHETTSPPSSIGVAPPIPSPSESSTTGATPSVAQKAGRLKTVPAWHKDYMMA